MSSTPNTAGGHNNMASPLADVSSVERKALTQTNRKMTITWIDDKTSNVHQITDIPLALFLAYCPAAARSLTRGNDSTAQSKYDLGRVSHLLPGAGRYVIAALVKSCDTPDAMPPAYHEPANVLRHIQCLAALKKMGITHCVQHAWRGATMDAVRAAGRVTAEQFIFFYNAFNCGLGGEPMLLKHLIHSVVYAELTDEVESPDTLAINRFAYGSQPALAVMKKNAERTVEKKLMDRRAMEEQRAERERKRREYHERRQAREAAQRKKQAQLEQARNGERALTEGDVRSMGTRDACPRFATVSKKLR
ncbi:hypothetical protein SLS58_008441 [Diplodia intermedia]|uniref:Uncharacterized protein n=1 Tax=Diplodia intermedia TaxID=856260 RepID=A0ABR3THJ7_9PEZI